MKRNIMLIAIIVIGLLIIPFTAKARTDEYKILNFKEALADEDMELINTNYKETDEQITIYLFRGKGCGYCKAYLEFMNSISEEYGQYFKIESYEVWNNTNNNKLMKEVANYLGEEANGVPFIIIGEQVFSGYSDTYNEKIKAAITDLYNTAKKDRYDVFEEMQKSELSKGSKNGNANIIVWNLVFIILATITIIICNNSKYKKISNEIQSLKQVIKKTNTKTINNKTKTK